MSKRFFAGGGTTIRGFTQNSVGPATFTGTELGGTGMLVRTRFAEVIASGLVPASRPLTA